MASLAAWRAGVVGPHPGRRRLVAFWRNLLVLDSRRFWCRHPVRNGTAVRGERAGGLPRCLTGCWLPAAAWHSIGRPAIARLQPGIRPGRGGLPRSRLGLPHRRARCSIECTCPGPWTGTRAGTGPCGTSRAGGGRPGQAEPGLGMAGAGRRAN